MTFAVIIQRRAEGDLDEVYLGYLHERSEAEADGWLANIYSSLATLVEMPERFGLAYEARMVSAPVRQLLIGRRRACYRALFLVRPGSVFVLRVRHAYRAPLLTADLELPDGEDNWL